MPGSGLGLAIVRQVAEAHGGEVEAERAEGGGTRIKLRLNNRVEPHARDGGRSEQGQERPGSSLPQPGPQAKP
jgi:hypothetical protein